jgi:hypothetical protein
MQIVKRVVLLQEPCPDTLSTVNYCFVNTAVYAKMHRIVKVMLSLCTP